MFFSFNSTFRFAILTPLKHSISLFAKFLYIHVPPNNPINAHEPCLGPRAITPFRSELVSYPDISLSIKVFAQRKAGRRKWERRRFASLLYPSNGPLRFVTSHSRFALASMRNHAKNEGPAWGGGWKWAILFCFFHSHLQCSFVFKTPLGKYGSRKSCVLCFENEINRLWPFLSYHFAVALVYIAVKWYVWQHTLRDLWTF